MPLLHLEVATVVNEGGGRSPPLPAFFAFHSYLWFSFLVFLQLLKVLFMMFLLIVPYGIWIERIRCIKSSCINFYEDTWKLQLSLWQWSLCRFFDEKFCRVSRFFFFFFLAFKFIFLVCIFYYFSDIVPMLDFGLIIFFYEDYPSYLFFNDFWGLW